MGWGAVVERERMGAECCNLAKPSYVEEGQHVGHHLEQALLDDAHLVLALEPGMREEDVVVVALLKLWSMYLVICLVPCRPRELPSEPGRSA